MGLVTALAENGFLRIERAVSKDMCAQVLQAIAEFSGLSCQDQSTWYLASPELEDIVPLWGHPAQWAIREEPALYAVWSELWSTRDLLVSLDRCRFTPPWRPGRPEPLELHWDLDPRGPERTIQGLVALTDSGPGAGGFRCAPSFFRDDARWPADPVPTARGFSWDVCVPEAEVVEVRLQVGDLLVWDSRLPHANSRNLSHAPRAVFYVLMSPVLSESERSEHLECWLTGRCHEAWRGHWPEHDHLEPWAPVQLGTLGRRLIGLEQTTP